MTAVSMAWAAWASGFSSTSGFPLRFARATAESHGTEPPRSTRIPKNRWQGVEVMVKLNSRPEIPDGELALWLDGKLIMHVAKGTPQGPWSGMG